MLPRLILGQQFLSVVTLGIRRTVCQRNAQRRPDGG
jgi:hypothetical protein